MSAEETFRRVLTARLPAGPGWTAWIDGTVAELTAGVEGVTLDPEEVQLALAALRSAPATTDGKRTPAERALAARLEAAS